MKVKCFADVDCVMFLLSILYLVEEYLCDRVNCSADLIYMF